MLILAVSWNVWWCSVLGVHTHPQTFTATRVTMAGAPKKQGHHGAPQDPSQPGALLCGSKQGGPGHRSLAAHPDGGWDDDGDDGCYQFLVDVCWCLLMFVDVCWCDVCWCLLMFVDVCWCLLMFVDVCWCLLMFVDVCWCLLMFVDVCWCLLMFADVCWCLLMFVDVCWRLLTFVDVCWCLLMFVDVCWCLLMFVDVCWCLLMFVDVCWCLLMFVKWWTGWHFEDALNLLLLPAYHLISKCLKMPWLTHLRRTTSKTMAFVRWKLSLRFVLNWCSMVATRPRIFCPVSKDATGWDWGLSFWI